MLPCGTPQVINFCSDVVSFILTFCFLLVRYDLNHAEDPMPIALSLLTGFHDQQCQMPFGGLVVPCPCIFLLPFVILYKFTDNTYSGELRVYCTTGSPVCETGLGWRIRSLAQYETQAGTLSRAGIYPVRTVELRETLRGGGVEGSVARASEIPEVILKF